MEIVVFKATFCLRLGASSFREITLLLIARVGAECRIGYADVDTLPRSDKEICNIFLFCVCSILVIFLGTVY